MKKILIVDDDALGVEILKKRLEVNNYETIFVSNSKEALEKVKTERPNLILLDLILPDEDGSEVCKILKTDSQTKSIPLLILTVKREVEAKLQGLEAGADDYLTKPYDHRELLARIRVLLRRKKEEEKLIEREKLISFERSAEKIARAINNPLQRISERIEFLLAIVEEGKAPLNFLDLLVDSLKVMREEAHQIKENLKMEKG